MIDGIEVDIEGDGGERVEMAFPAHPGEVLRDWIDGHKVTVTETARRVGMSRAALNRVLSGRGAMGPRLAVALEDMGWSDAAVWMGMQAQWEIARVKRERSAA